MLIDLNNTYLPGNIRYLRRRFHLSRRDLATLAGISLIDLCRIEKKDNIPVDYTVAVRFSEIFGLSIEMLFHKKNPSCSK